MPTAKKRYLDSTPAVTKQQLAKTNKHSKSGIPVTYFTQSDAMPLLADNPNRTVVLDEVTVRPYKKLPMQSKLFQGITNQAANEKADEYVDKVTPTAEDLLNIGTLGGLNNLSPTQWARRAYDLRKAIKGNMSWDKFGNNWFYGNNGLVSDKYVQKHPYTSAAINLAGDIGAVGTLSALRKLPKYAKLMKAENRAAQEATALNWRDMLSNNVKRTRIGDVEIDNPNLLYHLDRGNSAGAFSNQGAYVEDGILFPGVAKKEGQLGYSWWNKGKPYTTSVKGQPMTRLMTATKDTPGMLQVRSQNYPIGQWTGSKGFVLSSEYVNPEGVNVSESIYTLDPTYGWRRVSKNTPTLNWADATKTPIITTENAINITPKQWTAAQDAAIARGDIAEAQRLRDLHFMTKAPNTFASINRKPLQLYHGTNSNFNAFDLSRYGSTDGGTFGRGVYTTPIQEYAQLYGKNNMPLYMKLDNPRDYRNYSIGDLIAEKLAFGENFATGNGIDGVIGRPSWKGFKGLEEYVSHNPRNIKSSKAVTYDDNGVRIPLGERDNFKLNDIRYGLLPIIGGGIGYGLYNKKSNKNKNIR